MLTRDLLAREFNACALALLEQLELRLAQGAAMTGHGTHGRREP